MVFCPPYFLCRHVSIARKPSDIRTPVSNIGRLSYRLVLRRRSCLSVLYRIPFIYFPCDIQHYDNNINSFYLSPFRTAVPFGGQTSLIPVMRPQNGTTVLKGVTNLMDSPCHRSLAFLPPGACVHLITQSERFTGREQVGQGSLSFRLLTGRVGLRGFQTLTDSSGHS